jgi:uncharacterized membrane protein
MELLFIIVLTLLLVPLVVLTSGALRIAIGALFLIFFPGYALVAALFPRKDSLDAIERVALSFGLSIVVVPLIGLILNYAWEIRVYPVVVSVASFIVIASVVALYRRRSLPKEQRFEPRLRIKLPHWDHWSKMDKALSVVLAFSMVAAIGAMAYAVAVHRVGERFTEFYVLDPGGTAQYYPTKLMVGQPGEVILRVVNHEREDSSYHIEVSIDSEKMQEVGPISLANGEKWEEKVTFVPTKAGEGQKIEFLLHKGEESQPYHELYLWIDVEEAE